MGYDVEIAAPMKLEFGCAQMAWRREDGYLSASDSRKDGCAIGH